MWDKILKGFIYSLIGISIFVILNFINFLLYELFINTLYIIKTSLPTIPIVIKFLVYNPFGKLTLFLLSIYTIIVMGYLIYHKKLIKHEGIRNKLKTLYKKNKTFIRSVKAKDAYEQTNYMFVNSNTMIIVYVCTIIVLFIAMMLLKTFLFSEFVSPTFRLDCMIFLLSGCFSFLAFLMIIGNWLILKTIIENAMYNIRDINNKLN